LLIPSVLPGLEARTAARWAADELQPGTLGAAHVAAIV
jgi:hypothetical protein